MVSVCVGNYAKTPYCVPGLEINVYCMEELCYCLKENAFLLDLSLLDEALLGWLEKECGVKELAKALSAMIYRKGSLSGFVVMILEYVGFYDAETVREVEQILKKGAGLSGIEKRKSQIDHMVKQKRYAAAIHAYHLLIEKWESPTEGEDMPAADCFAAILHNEGVAYAGLMNYHMAAELFLSAYEKDQKDDYYVDFLAAKRMLLAESEYVSFAAEHTEGYRHTLMLEKKMERFTQEWEQQPEYLRLYHRRDWRAGGEKQRYYEENESLTQALKDHYRSIMGEV